MGAPPPNTMADNLVGDACRFFDHLADLVDPKYYYDDQREPVNMRFMKKTARSAAKAALKEHYKQNKRAKLDPDAAVTTVELQRSKQEAKQRGAASEARQSSQRQQQQDQGQEAAGLQLKIASGPAPSRDELLKRLHQRLEAARSQRHAEEAGPHNKKDAKSPGDQAKAWRQQQLGKQLKQQQQAAAAGKKRKAEGEPEGRQQQQGGKGQQPGKKAKQQQQQQQGQGQQQGHKQQQQQQQQQGDTLQVSKVIVDADKQQHGKQHKKKKPSKEVLLKAAQERQQVKQQQDDEASKARAAQLAWQAALSRAQGEKVLDDPKLLRRSIKKDAKKKKRSAKKWQERMGAQQEAKQARQDRRKDNLVARSKTKQDNKKAKREKKLLRAGFEGRKAGFIASGSKGAAK